MIKSREQVYSWLSWMKQEVSLLPPWYYSVCMEVLNDPRFILAYGSAGKHHAYEGGLVMHTAEVLETCLHLANLYKEADKTVLTVAAVYHDCLKMQEYRPEEKGIGYYSDGKPVKLGKTPFRNLIRHVAGGYAELKRNLDDVVTPNTVGFEEQVMKIEHCILSHHGRLEWGSPVEPQILEAHILHTADMLSWQFGESR